MIKTIALVFMYEGLVSKLTCISHHYRIIPGVKDDDIFWVDAVHQMYVERHSKGRDDLLFFVKWDAKQVCLH